MAILEEPNSGPPVLSTSREPVAAKDKGTGKSVGEEALHDALLMVGISWAVLALLYISLRSYNI